jgi:hypothetical protein
MFKKIMMGTALIAAVAAFDPSVALARGGHGGGGGGHMGGGGGAHFSGGGAHFGGGGFARGGGGGFARGGGGMSRQSFASPNSGMMRNGTVNRSFNSNAMAPRSFNGARASQNMQYHRWNNGGGRGHHHGGWWRHRGWGYGVGGLALGYGLYGGYYDDPYAYYGDDYYDNYAYNDEDCYRAQRYYRGGVWRTRTVNVCQ